MHSGPIHGARGVASSAAVVAAHCSLRPLPSLYQLAACMPAAMHCVLRTCNRGASASRWRAMDAPRVCGDPGWLLRTHLCTIFVPLWPRRVLIQLWGLCLLVAASFDYPPLPEAAVAWHNATGTQPA